MNFVVMDPPHNVRRYQNNAHAAYNVFGSNAMKDTAKFLGDVKEPGAHEDVFRAGL